jgi:hypothetical protein
LFKQLGYSGWVILFDESELVGRLGKKTRLKAYNNMAHFLFPPKQLESTFSLFAFTSSYVEDVIEAKKEFQNLSEVYPEDEEPMKSVLEAIIDAPQLDPLSESEIIEVLEKIILFHGKAYDWQPDVNLESMFSTVKSGGHLLRSKIRAAIEYLDQLLLYGDVGESTFVQLSQESFAEEDESSAPVEAE